MKMVIWYNKSTYDIESYFNPNNGLTEPANFLIRRVMCRCG